MGQSPIFNIFPAKACRVIGQNQLPIKRSQQSKVPQSKVPQSKVPREIEQNVATTGGPRWERGDSGMVWGRNEDLSGNRAKPTARANPAPVTPSKWGQVLHFDI